MADILCAVCSEPWDAYGVHHGDMMAWEATLFKGGHGCPCCKGIAPEHLSLSDREELAVESARSMFDGWDDPHSFEHLNDVIGFASGAPMPKRKAWEPPKREPIWTCAGCKASAVRPLQFSLSEKNKPESNRPEWEGGEKVHRKYGLIYKRGDSLDRGDCDEEPCATIDGKAYCDLCAQWCDECLEKAVFSRSELEAGDPYSPGSAFQSSDYFGKIVCIDCYELESSETNDDDENEGDDE